MPTDEDVHSLSVDLPSARGPDWGRFYIAVPSEVLYFTIDVLRCIVAQWQPPEGIEPEDQAANRVMTGACQALASLMRAHTTHNRLDGAPELVEHIDNFLRPQWAEERLRAVRVRELRPGGKEAQRDIIEALIALARKRHEEQEG
jgi:hypothetical protein